MYFGTVVSVVAPDPETFRLADTNFFERKKFDLGTYKRKINTICYS